MKYFLYIILMITSSYGFAEKVMLSTVPRVEMLMGLNSMSDTVQILVESNGCTSNESFFVQKYIDRVDEMTHLNFIRVMPDWCKAYYPKGVWVRFSKDELQISPKEIIRIDNPFGSNRHNKN